MDVYEWAALSCVDVYEWAALSCVFWGFDTAMQLCCFSACLTPFCLLYFNSTCFDISFFIFYLFDVCLFLNVLVLSRRVPTPRSPATRWLCRRLTAARRPCPPPSPSTWTFLTWMTTLPSSPLPMPPLSSRWPHPLSLSAFHTVLHPHWHFSHWLLSQNIFFMGMTCQSWVVNDL